MKNSAKLQDRREAGRLLAGLLGKYRRRAGCIVLGLPRGGVVVGCELALLLELPLDVCVVRKLGVPLQPELAMGAVALGGVCVLREDVISDLGISQEEIDREIRLELVELARRERTYRGDRPAPSLSGKTVLLTDDGIATGATIEAAISAVRRQGAGHIVVAAGVAPPETMSRLARLAGEAVAVKTPRRLSSIGEWFEDFTQTTDEQVRECLRIAHAGELP